jgi:hypothetical protein
MAKATSIAAPSKPAAATREENAIPSNDDPEDPSPLYAWAWIGAVGYICTLIVYSAYRIRMGAIEEFGPVIHEFDPYFNFRATEVSNTICHMLHSDFLVVIPNGAHTSIPLVSQLSVSL